MPITEDFIITCIESLSSLSKIEPAFGVIIAVNVGYLCLERFRYRKRISDHAKSELSRFEDDEIPQKILDTKWYSQVLRLADLPHNDGFSPQTIGKCKMPDSLWGFIYSIIFEKHVDRWLSGIILFIS